MYSNSSNYVPGTGPKNARIVIVGEAPGAQEALMGQPFVGGSGKLLTAMLSAAKIDRYTDCYLTNVVKTQPPNNNFDVLYVDGPRRQQPSELLLKSIEALDAELSQLRPNVIVPVGDEALRAVTGLRGITKWRGSMLRSKTGVKTIPTLHPAFVLRMYRNRAIVELDLKRVHEESAFPEIRLPYTNFEISPTFERVMSYLAQRPKRLAFDIETFGPFVRCLGLSAEKGHAICIPFISKQIFNTSADGSTRLFISPTGSSFKSHWTVDQETAIISKLYELFADPKVELCAQNAQFDCGILSRQFGLVFGNLYMDTMLAHHTCYCEMPKGLDFLCSIYTRTPYYSDHDSSDDRSNAIYNCYDASVTFEISYVLDKEMADLGVEPYYRYIKHAAMMSLQPAETKGVLVDVEEKQKRTEKTKQELQNIKTEVDKITGGAIVNLSSDKQIKDYLYDVLKLKPILHHKTKNVTSDKFAREKLRKQYPQHDRLFELLEQYSIKDTLLTGFLQRDLASDNRMRTHYNAAGTVTDRLSSSSPMHEPGTNLQNIPKGDFKQMFIADPGYVLCKCDLSQAEFRIVVWLAKIRRIIDKYKQNPDFDVHTWVASLIFKVPEDKVERKRTDGRLSQRDIAKNGVYGGNYSMHYVTAARTYKMNLQDAKFVLDAYRSAIPEIPQWWLSVQNELLRTRCLTNPLGRKRLYLDRLEDDCFREAYSDSAQSVVSGVVNRAFAISTEVMDPEIAGPLLQVHDEIVFYIKRDPTIIYNTVIQIKNLFEYPLKFPDIDEPLCIPADIGIGSDWFNQHKLIHNKTDFDLHFTIETALRAF